MIFFGFNFFPGIWGLLLLPLSILAAIWTWKDANRLGLSPLLWAGIAFSVFPFGFIIYLLYRTVRKLKV
jgi:hypothetical protein